MSPSRLRAALVVTGTVVMIAAIFGVSRSATVSAHTPRQNPVAQNAVNKVERGQQTFRFDTFGD